MSKTAFISMTFSQKDQITGVITRLKAVLSTEDIQSTVFVEDYSFDRQDEDNMMTAARAEISKCDFLIAELSHKAVGVGIEVGYAVGIGKPVIYMRDHIAEHSTTVAGISSYKIVYISLDDMEHQLRRIIPELME